MPVIFHDFTIKVSKKKIFEAIATPQGMNKWWTLKCEGKFKKGETVNLNFTDDYDWRAKITEFSQDKSIEFKMTKAKEDWMPTSFGFLLTAVGPNVTSVEFYHKNWAEITKEYKIATYCWGSLLSQMKQYLEKGIITPFEKRN